MKPASHQVCWGGVAVVLAGVLPLLVLAGCESDRYAYRAESNFDTADATGMAYAMGQGVPQDYKEALRWFRRGAQTGHAEAQYHLGVAFSSGRDFQPNYVEAYKWFALAAAQGHEPAIKARDNIARKLTREQLDDGQREAAEFAISDTEEIAKARALMRQTIVELNEHENAFGPEITP